MCEYCGYNFEKPKDRFKTRLAELIKYNYSEAYIEAVLYSSFSNSYSIGQISAFISEAKKQTVTL